MVRRTEESSLSFSFDSFSENFRLLSPTCDREKRVSSLSLVSLPNRIHEERFLFKLKLKKERMKLKNEIKQQR